MHITVADIIPLIVRGFGQTVIGPRRLPVLGIVMRERTLPSRGQRLGRDGQLIRTDLSPLHDVRVDVERRQRIARTRTIDNHVLSDRRLLNFFGTQRRSQLFFA
ncbi:hypothetical protein HMPREF0058_0927 [Actinomyces urogenitalis DSM 15434]|uniref:Uncharacterized protein n=1 Tax=Actinomyces urogenitalis DSM 15434 TaxID=525246 RepID=C0W4Y3_9ACTO|nr:hypothetical protein HMPREF0058_0927 [Actinomyces urogenitalis DSM 15434]